MATKFPLLKFFADAPQPLFTGTDREADARKANGCMRHVRGMFTELEECRAFELLKGMGDRSNYLLTRQAKVVAMTCTHAALKRRDFLKLGFKYDNLVMEESAQVLEIETFIPMMLQKPTDGRSRLKRVVLIGSPPAPAGGEEPGVSKYCNMDQSLFARFVRDWARPTSNSTRRVARDRSSPSCTAGGTARGDLPPPPRARTASPTRFAHESQFVDVEGYEGAGESAPTPHFYKTSRGGVSGVRVSVHAAVGVPREQNIHHHHLPRAETFIRDVVARRCASHPFSARRRRSRRLINFRGSKRLHPPVSMVPPRPVGHVRDVRRLVVAMSRARLGLYVFGRRTLFEQCYELEPAFKHLLRYPTKLAIAPTVVPAATRRRKGHALPRQRYHRDGYRGQSAGAQVAAGADAGARQRTRPPVAPPGVMNDDEDDRGAQEY